MKLLKIILIFFLVSNADVAFSQIQKMKATAFTSRYLNSYQKWSNWGEIEKVSILVVLDLNNERIKIYSREEQEYDVISSNDSFYDEDGDYFMEFVCINKDGLRCIVSFATIYSRGGFQQVYIKFSDMQWMYYIENF
jgi:hypothetical protein